MKLLFAQGATPASPVSRRDPNTTSALRARVVLRSLIDLAALPQRNSASSRGACNDMGGHGGREHHERTYAEGSKHERHLRALDSERDQQAAESQRRGLGGRL